MSRGKTGPQHGKHAGYRQTSDEERMLAVLRVESGVPIETVAAEFNVTVATGVRAWIERWRERSVWFDDQPTDAEIERAPSQLWPHVVAAGYVFELVDSYEGSRGWRYDYRVDRGPQWSPQRAGLAANALAMECFASAIRDMRTMTKPTIATLGAIGRVYRCLDAESQALYAPVWDLCQLALDEMESGRAKFARAADLAVSLQPARSEARAA